MTDVVQPTYRFGEAFPETLLFVNLITGNRYTMRFKSMETVESTVDVPKDTRMKVLRTTTACRVMEAFALLGIGTEAVDSECDPGDVSLWLSVDKEPVVAKAPLGFVAFKDFPCVSKCLIRAMTPGHVPVGLFMPNGTAVEASVTARRNLKVRTWLRVALYDTERP